MAASPAPSIEIRRGADRFRTRLDWLDSRHSFSFGSYYDPANTHFGLLLVSNDDVVSPGTGFTDHPHRDTEIVTWVLDGALAHRDSAGCSGVVEPGVVQRMSAGTGVVHAEENASAERPVRFVQMWVRPAVPGGEPSYQQRDVSAALAGGALVPVAGGRDGVGVALGQPDAVLHVARLAPGGAVDLPDAPYIHLYLAAGGVDVEEVGRLVEGDAARLTAAGARRVTCHPDGPGAEILVWEMATGLGPAG